MDKINYAKSKFFTTVNELKDLPETTAEIAFCGRSNAGKSSLINTLTRQNRLAFTSKTPGRTQHINYFTINDSSKFLVDLPGYGYAKVPEHIRLHWQKILSDYLQNRKQLLGLVLIMDSRHPLKELDYIMLDFFTATNKFVHIVLSKADKLSKQQQQNTLDMVKKQLAQSNITNASLQLFSAPKRIGVEILENTLTTWFNDVVLL